ncbi:MAG: flagellar basal body P-ring formation chaperone FlgA [Sulfurimonas sp.]|nr:flagellar basal body P-ring formation chaperone FlgA [Sulfurimonas sp.]
MFLTLNLFSDTLNSTYFVDSNNIKLRDIFPTSKYDITLYKIQNNRHSKKVKTKELIKQLSKHDYTSLKSSSRYVRFIIKSPINLSFIEKNIMNAFKEVYPDIDINSLFIIPRGYLKKLPEKYTVKMPKKFFLSNTGTASIRTLKNKKIFFDYVLDATIPVYILKDNVKKATKISILNVSRKNIQLEKIRDLPTSKKHLNTTQAKRNLKAKSILTLKDIQTLNLIKKGSYVVVNIDNNNINISFSAKALQSGKLHDIITVQKSNKKRLRVQIIGRNQVKVR